MDLLRHRRKDGGAAKTPPQKSEKRASIAAVEEDTTADNEKTEEDSLLKLINQDKEITNDDISPRSSPRKSILSRLSSDQGSSPPKSRSKSQELEEMKAELEEMVSSLVTMPKEESGGGQISQDGETQPPAEDE